jgi:small-conductance mechanosensitive channel
MLTKAPLHKEIRLLVHLLSWFVILLLLSGCGIYGGGDSSSEPTEIPTSTLTNGTPRPGASSAELEATTEPDGEADASEPLGDVELATRTPNPTATPGILVEGASQITEQLGLDQQTILGLGVDDWLVLGVGVLLILGVYFLTTWLVKRVFPRLASRTETQIDDILLEIAGREIHWLVLVIALQIVTPRLVFLPAGLKSLLVDVYFVLTTALIMRITWHLFGFAEKEAHRRLAEQERDVEMAPVLKLVIISAKGLAIIIFTSILLSHFGVEVVGLVAALGLGGLALALAARDTIADAIAGLIILIDRPFRVGDRIEIQGLGTWGDVTNIGLRSTSIRTRDNVMVFVPNSTISSNEIINYSYPDPEYRIQTHISIAYGTPISSIQKLVSETMENVDGVMQKRNIDVLYHEMGDSAMIFRVRWWISTYADKRQVIDRVHIALQEAIDGAGLESPFNTQTIDLQINPESAGLLKELSSDTEKPDQDD